MADVFLILVIVVAFLILLVSSVYFLVYYQHPEDRNTAYFPKLVVLGAFLISGFTVLGLPLDVANNAGYTGCDGYNTSMCGGLDMELFWDIFFWLIPMWIFVLIPFSAFYYEADDNSGLPTSVTGESSTDPKQRSRLSQALCNVTVLVMIVTVLFFLAYWFLGYSHVTVRTYMAGTIEDAARPAGVIYQSFPHKNADGVVQRFSIRNLTGIQANDELLLQLVKKKKGVDTMTYRVDVSIFYGGFMTFIGWFLFSLFGGIGLAALPLHNILAFTNRPKMLTPEEMATAKASIQGRVNEMVEIGEQLKREREDKSKTSARQGLLASLFPTFYHKRSSTLREFKAAVYMLEEDVRDFTAYQIASEKYNPLYPYLALLIGLVSSVFSICWFLQTVLYTLPNPPVTKFLNELFEWFDTWFPLFGTLSVAFATLYLLLCSVQGCFVFGMRFLCLSFYPMKVGKTYMNSFLFNMGLVLFTSLPVVQFAVISFRSYAENATITQIYEEQIDNLDFFTYFFDNDVFVYALLIISCLTGLYMMICQRRGNEGAELRDRLKSRARAVSATADGPPMGDRRSGSSGETGAETFDDEHDEDLSDYE